MANELFGASVTKNLLQQSPPSIPNEEQLLREVTEKVGPWADQQKLLHHIRASRGKVHWAVNSYFRAILTAPRPASAREDFDCKSNSNWQTAPHKLDGKRAAAAGPAPDESGGSAAPASRSNTSSVATTGQASSSSSRDTDGFAVPSNKLPLSHTLQGSHKVAAAGAAAAAAKPPPAARALAQSLTAASNAAFDTAASATAAAGTTLSANDDVHAGSKIAAGEQCASSLPAPGASVGAPGLDSLPGFVLEQVLSHLELQSLVSAACSCKLLHKAAQADQLWRQLFKRRWCAIIFPTSKYGCTGSGIGSGSSQAAGAQLQQAEPSMRVAAAAAAMGGSANAGAHTVGADAGALSAAGRAAGGGGNGGGSGGDSSGSSSSSSSSSNFVSRWTGSTISGSSNNRLTAAGSVVADAAGAVQAVAAGWAPAASADERAAQCSYGPTCSCCRCTAVLPAVAPCGSWQQQYRQQHGFAVSWQCPKCGDGHRVLPIVYGFPSAVLLQGMQSQRLVLGGDHLLDTAHVWACSCCRSCFRYFPYDVQLWLQDDKVTAAASGMSAGQSGSEQPGMEGLPRYTYEL